MNSALGTARWSCRRLAVQVAIAVQRFRRRPRPLFATTAGRTERSPPPLPQCMLARLRVASAVCDRRAFVVGASPNQSLKPTRRGMRRKPGPRQSYYRRSPGLRRTPLRAA